MVLDPPPTGLGAFLLRSRRRGAIGMALLCGVLVVIQAVFILANRDAMEEAGYHPARLWMLPVIALGVGMLEALAVRDAGRRLRTGGTLPLGLRIATAIGEAALPTMGVLLFAAATDWSTALRSPPVFGYFLILMLTILRLDARACLLVGGIEASSFFGLIALGVSAEGADVRALLGFLVGAGVLILVATGIAAAIARQTRRFVVDLIASHEAAARAAVALAVEAGARKQAETVIWQKDRLLAVLGHDLRAPLNGVSWLADSLADAPERFTDDEIRKYAGEIRRTSGHLRELIDNLLAWARCRTGQLAPEIQAHSAREILDDAVALLAPVFASKALNLRRDSADADLFTDASLLRIVLRNVLSNAAKFTPRGGRVDLACRRHGDNVEIAVCNPGVFPASVLAGWCATDVSPPTAGTDGEPGSGIGLPLCAELVRRLGGEIEIANDPGAVVRIRLPGVERPPIHEAPG